MSEFNVSDCHDQKVVQPLSESVTAGKLLRSAREAAGLHIAALAVSMKVPVKKLEALEADRIDLLPDSVFVRALASSVCRALKINSAPILALLPQMSKPSFDTGDRGSKASFKPRKETRSLGFSEALKQPFAKLVIGLLLAAIAIVVIPDFREFDITSKFGTIPISEPREGGSPLQLIAVEKASEKQPQVEVVPGAMLAETTVAAVPLSEPNDMVMIRAKGTTWVEVVDARGVVLVRRILQADNVTSANGVPPLALVIGRADMVEVEVRGKPFDVSGLSKENVARFEVK
jgi:cytoskeleton protein RodZ